MNLTADEIFEIQGILLLANTPGFVVRKLQELESVRRLKADCSPDELAKELDGLVARSVCEDRDAEAAALAILVALATSDDAAVRNRIRGRDLRGVAWGKAIVESALADPVSTTTATLSHRPVATGFSFPAGGSV